jgi:hypothetical protein
MNISFNYPAIIYINTDLVPQVLGVFTTQLFITQVLSAADFDANVAADPNYPLQSHLNGYRLLVLRDLSDMTNRQFADIVLFAKGGLVSVLNSHYGKPGITLAIDRIYLSALIHLDRPPPCAPFFGRPDIYDLFKGHPKEAYDRDYNQERLDPPFNVEPRDE